MTKSTGHLEPPCFHCPPMIGAETTFGTADPASVAGFDQSRWPMGVSTARVFIAAATFVLSFGLPLALSTACATSNRARLGPSCWFHCLPLVVSYPPARSLLEIPVSVDLYGHVGAQYTPEARPLPIDPSDETCDGNKPVLAICPI